MERNIDIMDTSPALVFRSSDEKRKIERFIEANLGVGRLLPDIARMIIHPITGLPCTPEQLMCAFPEQCNGGSALANAKVTASLYTQAIEGEKGSDMVKASIKWLEATESDKWKPSAKLEVSGQIDVEVQHKVESAMDKVRDILDGIAVSKRGVVIEHQPPANVAADIVDAEIVDVTGRE